MGIVHASAYENVDYISHVASCWKKIVWCLYLFLFWRTIKKDKCVGSVGNLSLLLLSGIMEIVNVVVLLETQNLHILGYKALSANAIKQYNTFPIQSAKMSQYNIQWRDLDRLSILLAVVWLIVCMSQHECGRDQLVFKFYTFLYLY